MITGATNLGDDRLLLTVDHDPTVVATDCFSGSIIVRVPQGEVYFKKDDGSTTNVTFNVNIKNNFSATTAPTTGDDSTLFYSVGSLWINTVTQILYVNVDATAGAAVWVPVTSGPQGPQGFQGPSQVGVQGPQGFQGFGFQGPQGNQGPSEVGTQGPQGFQGPSQAGVQGPQGNQGPSQIGAQGPQGFQGFGFQGNQGNQGPSAAGVQGPQGFQGSGVQGPQGPRGIGGGILYSSMGNNALGANQTRFIGVGAAGFSATESQVQLVITRAATLQNLTAKANSNTRADATTVTVRKNNANTAITVSIPAGSTATFQDLVNTVAVAAGDVVSIQFVTTGGGGNISAMGSVEINS